MNFAFVNQDKDKTTLFAPLKKFIGAFINRGKTVYLSCPNPNTSTN